MKDVYILAIETSCDETSVAVVKNGSQVVAMNILSQMDTHALYGGVIPEIASRMHTENITLVLDDTLKKANLSVSDMDAIAVTYAPGLLGSLLVGLECAKTLAFIYDLPLIKVNHIIGHIYANNFNKKMTFPTLALIISGGHTQLVLINDHYDFKTIGATLDDAIGEAYDKVARVIGLSYPGGPNLEKLALNGVKTYDLPQPMLNKTLDFSFSGLKSSVINLINNENMRKREINRANLARSFQEVATASLVDKVELAIKEYDIKNMLLAGGVSANKYIQKEMKKITDKYEVELSIPEFIYCTDNAAMIGAAAYPLYLKKEFADYSLNPESRIDIDLKA